MPDHEASMYALILSIDPSSGVGERIGQAGDTRYPDRTVEHAMIVLELTIVAHACHSQHGGDRAFVRCQDVPHDQYVHPYLHPFTEQQFECPKDVYNRAWEVAHGSFLPER